MITTLKLYNYLARQKETFQPLKKGKVDLYTCGPTVYDRVHIGNLRTYVFEDVLKKTLIHNGYKVKHVMNITDAEDKIIKKMREKKKTLKEVTVPYTKIFFSDSKKLNIKKADFYPRATANIKEMISLIERLLKKGFAYKGKNDSIYFDVAKFKNYGRLSLLDRREIKSGVRIEADEYNKKNVGDFVLWKATKPGEPSWKTPFGSGRPGWHIECSAMSMKYLGESFDIHAGGVDLLFPHHENEIAQSETATGKKFVNFWVEGEHLLVKGQRMAKSLGNFYTLEDIEKKKFNPLSFRYLALSAHYRSKLNFTWEALQNAQHTYQRLKNIVGSIKKEKSPTAGGNQKYLSEFAKATNDDLNMPQALAVLWKLIRDTKATGKYLTIKKMDQILSLDLFKKTKIALPATIKKLAKEREKARQNKNWPKADELRQKIESLGWIIEDTSRGPTLTKK